MSLRLRVLAAFAVFALPCAFAQTTGVIRGTVTDPSAAVIGGAKITAILQSTNTTRTTTSDVRGEYVFPTLAVGKYSIEIEATGFKKYVNRDLDVTIGRVVVADAALELGEVSQVVTAEAKAALVETSSTQLGAVVNETTVTNLPLNERDTYQLLQLQPGVQSQQGYDLFAGSEKAGVVSVNGGRGRSNNFNVNGGDGNDQFIGVPAIQPSPDTIQEFRVLTNTFDAEFGRNSGAVVNVVTKGGTNNIHGNLFEFFRNRALNTRGFFDSEKPDFKQNQFGGTFGGPIKKDRTFFFGSYEERRIVQGISSDLVTVPTAAERTGDFSAGTPFAGALSTDYTAGVLNARPGCAGAVAAAGGAPIASGTAYSSIFPNNKIPTPCFDPTAFDLLNQFVPAANRGDSQFQSVPGQRDRDHQGTLRIDHAINDHQQLNFYYYADDDALAKPFSRFQAAGANVPGFGSDYGQRIQQWNIGHTWVLNASSVNEFRFAYFREGQMTFNHPQHTNLVQDSCKTVPAAQCFSDPSNPKLGITPALGKTREGVPFISISGGFTIGNNSEGELPQVGNSFHWADNFSKVVGWHTFKFGADVRRQRFDQTLYFDINGNFGFYGGGPNDVGFDNLFPNYLLGLPDGYVQGSAQTENVRSTSVYLYAQDSWKIKPSLTLNYGLRWELNTPITEIGKRVQTYRPGQDTAIYPCKLDPSNPLVATFGTTDCSPGSAGESVFPRGLVVPGDRGIPPAMTQTYYKSFAPRIGLAWSPSASSGWLQKLVGAPGKTSIRMGWGMFYNPVEQLVLEQFSAEPPFGGSSSFTNILLNTPFVGQDGTINPNPFNGILSPPRGQALDWSRFRPILLYGQFQPHLRSQYSDQYNFTIQREIANNVVMQVGYVGTQGHRLLATHDINFGNAQSCLDLNNLSSVANDPNLACGPYYADSSFNIAAGEIPAGFTLHLPYGSVKSVTGPNANPITIVGLRPYSSPLCQPTTGVGCPPDGVPVFSSIFAQDTISNSNYNSLQANVEKRFSKGLSFQGAYTFSKSIDNASSFESILNPLDYRRSRSLSMFDARQRFVFSYYYQLPTFSLRGAAAKFLNGWSSSGIITFQDGFPIRITSLDDLELMYSYDFELPGEPDMVGKFKRLNPRGPGNYAFNQDAFAPQALGTIGSSPRTVCCGPGIDNYDFALHKDTVIHEQVHLEFRAEFFNIFNHAQFSKVDGNITDGVDFGRVTRARDPRLIQFALKLFF
jgi:outer membrane receptor protein involved in Fe transport